MVDKFLFGDVEREFAWAQFWIYMQCIAIDYI